MADRIDVRKYIEENRVRFSYGRRLPTRREHIRRRPRTPDSYATLSAMVRNRWQSWLEQGRIEVLGPRHYRIHLRPPREEARPPEET